jgi:hypothetical protein
VNARKGTPHPGPPPQGGRETNGGGACADGAEESCPHPIPPPQERERGQVSEGPVVWGAGTLLRRVGWLGRLMPRVERTVFLPLLNDPEMQAIFERAPQVGRILRPWCHVFGLEVPGWLRLPKRRRARRSDPSPRPTGSSPVAEPPSPTRGEGEKRRRRTPREIAEALIAWSERTGKAIDISKVSSVVWGYVVHTPRDENCPPPEIGYASRRWRPPR